MNRCICLLKCMCISNATSHTGKVAATSTFYTEWGCRLHKVEVDGDATSTLELWDATSV